MGNGVEQKERVRQKRTRFFDSLPRLNRYHAIMNEEKVENQNNNLHSGSAACSAYTGEY